MIMTAAPSIKEALKPCPFCQSTRLECGGDDKFVGVRCLDCEATGPNHYITGKDWNSLATFQPDGERREAITSPSDDLIGFAIQETFGGRCSTADADCYTCQAWSKYDRLASGLVQNEAGIRRDEREKCAKIADREAEFWQDAESSSARIIAANIRSARDGGAS